MNNSCKFLTLNHLVLSRRELSCLNLLAYNLTHGISRLEIKQYDRVNTKVDIRSCGRQPRAHGPKGEFTVYPFVVRFRPFFYVFASP